MATVDEQIQLAERIARELPEVTRNEWMRWMQVARQRGVDYAVRYAEQLSKDPTMRPAIQRANRLIAQAVRQHIQTLRQLDEKTQATVLGYVAWYLAIGTLRGSLRA